MRLIEANEVHGRESQKWGAAVGVGVITVWSQVTSYCSVSHRGTWQSHLHTLPPCGQRGEVQPHAAPVEEVGVGGRWP